MRVLVVQGGSTSGAAVHDLAAIFDGDLAIPNFID